MSQPNPEKLHVIKRDNFIEIHDLSDVELGPSQVYSGGPDLDCILDAIAMHFGFEGTEIHEVETENEDADPLGLNRFSTADLDNTESEEKIEIDGNPIGDVTEEWRSTEKELGVPEWEDKS